MIETCELPQPTDYCAGLGTITSRFESCSVFGTLLRGPDARPVGRTSSVLPGRGRGGEDAVSP